MSAYDKMAKDVDWDRILHPGHSFFKSFKIKDNDMNNIKCLAMSMMFFSSAVSAAKEEPLLLAGGYFSRFRPPSVSSPRAISPGGVGKPIEQLFGQINPNGTSKTYNGRTVTRSPNSSTSANGCVPRPGVLAVNPQGNGC